MLHFLPLNQLPYNVAVWAVGACAFTAIALRSTSRYRLTHNTLTGYFAWFWFVLAVGITVHVIPLLFTHNPHVIKVDVVTGHAIIYLGFVIQARILWYMALKPYMPFRYIATIVAVGLGIVTLLDAYTFSWVINDHMANGFNSVPASYIYGAIVLLVFVPIGLLFLREATRSQTSKARVFSVASGLTYIVIGVSESLNSFFNNRADDFASVAAKLIIFSIMFIVAIFPRRFLNRR